MAIIFKNNISRASVSPQGRLLGLAADLTTAPAGGATSVASSPVIGAPCENCPPNCTEQVQEVQMYLSPQGNPSTDKQVPVKRSVRECQSSADELLVGCDTNAVTGGGGVQGVRGLRGYQLANANDVQIDTEPSNSNTGTGVTTVPVVDERVYYTETEPCDAQGYNFTTTELILGGVLVAGITYATIRLLNKK